MYDADHFTLCLGPAFGLVDADSVNAGDHIIVERPEWHDQTRNTINLARFLVTPRTRRMIPKHGDTKVIGRIELAALAEVGLGLRSARVDALTPQTLRPLNSLPVLIGAL